MAEENNQDVQTNISLVVIGHVDAGKKKWNKIGENDKLISKLFPESKISFHVQSNPNHTLYITL